MCTRPAKRPGTAWGRTARRRNGTTPAAAEVSAKAGLVRVLLEGARSRRQLHPGVSAAVVDGDLRRREGRVSERADRDPDRAVLEAFLGVEEIGPADRAEAEPEPRALIAGAHVLAGPAAHLVGRREACQRCEHAAGAPLALEAVADADAERLAADGDAELAAAATGGADGRRHGGARLVLISRSVAYPAHGPKLSSSLCSRRVTRGRCASPAEESA